MVTVPADTVVGARENGRVQIVVGAGEGDRIVLVDPDAGTDPIAVVAPDALADTVRELEAREHPRWVWVETRRWYPRLLEAGVRVERCHDLRLCGAILDRSTSTSAARASGAHPRPSWLPPGPAEAAAAAVPGPAVSSASPHSTLFDLDDFDEVGVPDGTERSVDPARRVTRRPTMHRRRAGPRP